jgi:hypothetical protein
VCKSTRYPSSTPATSRPGPQNPPRSGSGRRCSRLGPDRGRSQPRLATIIDQDHDRAGPDRERSTPPPRVPQDHGSPGRGPRRAERWPAIAIGGSRPSSRPMARPASRHEDERPRQRRTPRAPATDHGGLGAASPTVGPENAVATRRRIADLPLPPSTTSAAGRDPSSGARWWAQRPISRRRACRPRRARRTPAARSDRPPGRGGGPRRSRRHPSGPIRTRCAPR